MTRPQQLTSLLHATQRLSLSSTTATRPSLAFTARTHPVAVRHASWSLGGLGELFKGRRQAARDQVQEANANKALASEQPKGLFDQAVEDERVQQVLQEGQPQLKPPTFHKSSTANFKTSRRKLNDLSRLIAGLGADEAVLQLKVSPKKQSGRLLSMLALARDHAIAKGLDRQRLVVAQSWTTPGPSLKRLDIKGRGRHGVKHHPSSKLHVLLAEGFTEEEKRRQRKKDQWRRSLRGLTEGDGVGVGRSRPVINQGMGGWRW